jgi:hypothetical protein
MNLLSDFFGKFLKLQQDSEETKIKIITIIKDFSGVNLEKEKISFKEGVLSVSCSPLERTQIYMNKDRIIEKLNSLDTKISAIK